MERRIDRSAVWQGDGATPAWLMAAFAGYIFLSYFEIYLTPFLGSATRYLMLGLIGLFVLQGGGSFWLHSYSALYCAWFAYRLASILWSRLANDSVSVHLAAQAGSVLLIAALSGQDWDGALARLSLRAHYWCSFLFGVLSLVFRRAYISEIFAARQVLTLFGRQNDPNNCAAFLLVGLALAGFSLLHERRYRLLNLAVIAVNGVALLLTGSRAGLLSAAMLVLVLAILPNGNGSGQATRALRRLAVLGFVGALAAFLVAKLLPVASLNRLMAFAEYQAGSGRAVKWRFALERFAERPVLGWGWGGIDYAEVGTIHNTFLTQLAEGGVVGGALFLLPMALLAVRGLRQRRTLAVLWLICGMAPSLFIEAINKRFLWNALLTAILLLQCGKMPGIWMDASS